MAVSGNIFSFFLPSRRRRTPAPPYRPQGAPLVEGLDAALAVVDSLDVSNEVKKNFEKDFKAAFEVKASPRAGYEPGKVAPVKVSLLDLASNPAKTVWETLDKSFEMNLPALDVPWKRAEKVVWEGGFEKVWVRDEKGVVPYIVQEATQRWTESTGIKITRELAEKNGLRNNPGLTRMMAETMSRHYSAIPAPTANVQSRVRELKGIADKARHVESVEELEIKLHEGTKTELIKVNGVDVEFVGGLEVKLNKDGKKFISVNGIEGALRKADEFKEGGNYGNAEDCWKAGSDYHVKWGKDNAEDTERTIREFEFLSSVDKKFAATPEAQYWSYWKRRNLHHQALNVLGAYKQDGLSGVARFYAWMPLKNWAFKEGTWRYYLYAPNIVNKLREKTIDRLLRPVLNKLTSLKSLANRVFKEYAKKALLWLVKKLGLKAAFAALGTAIPIPGVGTAIGIIVGAVVEFVGGLVIKKITVPAFRIAVYVFVGVIGFFVLFSIAIVTLISAILSNDPYPWEAKALEIDCNQAAAATSSCVVSKEVVKGIADGWGVGPGNHVNECYNDVIAKSQSAGVRPDFAMAIWLNESNASNPNESPADFGIRALDNAGFTAQINQFLVLPSSYKANYPQCFTAAEDPMLAFMTIFSQGATNCTNPDVIAEGQKYLDDIRTGAFAFVSSCSWPSYPK